MAENKKSFIFYNDWREIFEALPKDKGYDLLMHILAYVDDEDPKTKDSLIGTTFILIKQQLKRDLVKYRQYIDKQRDNGKKGGRPPKAKETQITQPLNGEPKKADTVNVTAIVNDNVLLKDVSSPPDGVDILHFHIAKGFYNLFLKKGDTKTLRKATVSYWVKIIRLLINEDKVTLEQLIAIKYYFEKCEQGDSSVKTWWFDNINSVAAFRKKNSDNEYHYDRITHHIKTWVKSDPRIQSEIFVRTNKLKEQTK